ncbi:MAG: hypothetical protein ACRDJX_07435 [Solirubrobacteraceae bacterium]
MAAEQRRIDWGSAEIEDGTLTVQLAGASTNAWKARFESVLALLDTPHSRWAEIGITKKAIKVSDVQQGSEAELRHLLESAVLQSNTDIAPDAPPPHADRDDGDEGFDADQQMAQTFRNFAAGAH